MTDLDIARAASPKPIAEIAKALCLPEEALEPYGKLKAKLDPAKIPGGRKAKLILVTAINPTPAGEGKTTVSIGLADAMRRAGASVCLALREPSLGPVFGVKGGAAGGGYAQILPMEEINLHFTGDLHAITTANNLLAALVDNHIQQGNELKIDPRRVSWRRCMDMNDRQLRQIVSGLGGKPNGMPREDGFDITAASEVMAIFCLAEDLSDLKKRLGRIVVGYSFAGEQVTASALKAEGAMAVLLKEALRPNLVQTLEGTPALVHGGPFANIAHGCNSVIATKTAMKLADYVVTEAGFGADLGAEKFLDIKCRAAGIQPSAVVVVATIRALKCHGGAKKQDLGKEDLSALERGLPNLLRHVKNMKEIYRLPVVVALNRFSSDSEAEIALVTEKLRELEVGMELCEVWGKGGAGGMELARAAMALCEERSEMEFSYPLDLPLEKKIEAVAKRVYGASGVSLAPGVRTELRRMDALGPLPVCIAKTQYSFSDDPKKLGAPSGFTLQIRQVRLSAGAGFAVAFAGEIIAMPGLPKAPAAEGIDILESGETVGIF
ncbi:MAG: formate--tetrahydrofolate ligase [Christensenellaceae bacterium]|jgi:formate--tetrahydrofolate ligase|nr:formate--tetrahydrofolate ligase [Christensenellaceae bacterium]